MVLLPVLAVLLALGAAGAPLEAAAAVDLQAVDVASATVTPVQPASPPPSTLGRLHCVCSPGECEPLDEEQCPGGAVWDACRCCRLCARVEDEPCGGPHGFHGACAEGLQCVVKGRPIREAREEGVCTSESGFFTSGTPVSRFQRRRTPLSLAGMRCNGVTCLRPSTP